jgi:hypothetical protein
VESDTDFIESGLSPKEWQLFLDAIVVLACEKPENRELLERMAVLEQSAT